MPNPLVFIEWTENGARERIVRHADDQRPVYEYFAARDADGAEVWRMIPCGSLPDKMAELIVGGWPNRD